MYSDTFPQVSVLCSQVSLNHLLAEANSPVREKIIRKMSGSFFGQYLWNAIRTKDISVNLGSDDTKIIWPVPVSVSTFRH